MTKFLHIADIHLGIRRYRSEERATDFFLAWRDCIERYALEEKVSFVLIAGDFFDARKVEPQAMNQAMFCLKKLSEAGIPVIEDRFTRDEIYIAEEAFLTGTAAEVTPIRELDGRSIGPGKPGEITKLVQDRFFAILRGEDQRHEDWLTYL